MLKIQEENKLSSSDYFAHCIRSENQTLKY